MEGVIVRIDSTGGTIRRKLEHGPDVEFELRDLELPIDKALKRWVTFQLDSAGRAMQIIGVHRSKRARAKLLGGSKDGDGSGS